MEKLVFTLIMILATVTSVSANPIPWPPPASMPQEDMYIQIQSNDGLHAVFTGDFTFTHIPEDVNSMLFPVPPDANNIRVRQDGVELAWAWSSERYPTVLPEMPTVPMINWQGPFPAGGAVFRVDYEHKLFERSGEFIFFYALGTGKYFPTYEKTTTANFDILLPAGYTVKGVWLDEAKHDYVVVGSHLTVTVESYFGPITHDLIVSLVPGYFEGCGVLIQGVECVLFRADTGGLYALDNLGAFNAGDRVWVRGKLNPYCAAFCMQGIACVEDNLISACPRCDFDTDGDVDTVDYTIFAEHWCETGCTEPDWCDGIDVTGDRVVDWNDLRQFGEDWLRREKGTPDKLSLSKYYMPYSETVTPNAPGYTLPLDINDVWNYDSMDIWFPMATIAPLLVQNGFAVLDDYVFPRAGKFSPPSDILEGVTMPYEGLRRMDVPLFITADTLLHLYHVQFDETLKDIEEHEFCGDVRALTAVLLDRALAQYDEYTGDLKEAAKRNVAYLAVAQKLIEPTAEVPDLVADTVANELAKIDAHSGFRNSDIFIYVEDYSQYVPRGHYTRSEELKRYFRTLMWYGRMAFLLKGAENWGPTGEALVSVYDAKIQTMQAILLARSVEQVEIGERSGREIWDRLYAVTSFYVGLADDLTPYEYLGALGKVFGTSFEPCGLEDENNFFALKVELALLRSPEIYGGTGNVFVTPPITPESLNEVLNKTKGMRFMGQRFIPDSYMFQHLVFPEVLNYTGTGDPLPFTLGNTGGGAARCYPRGLDVMAILGSDQAKTILTEEGDTDYVNYALRFDELKEEFDTFGLSDWNRNLYWGWLYALRALLVEFGEGYPNFMCTEAWQKKKLNAALASWTELRHDTILYSKQSYTAGFGGVAPPPGATGYVEPVPEFYGRLLALSQMTRKGLGDLDALTAQAETRLTSFENMLSKLIDIADKELMNQDLSSDDFEYIGDFPETLEEIITGVDGEGISTLLVADVHTHSVEEMVLEEGVGYVDLIVVACPLSNGSILLAAGPVLSYYEFKHPMSDRLTDEAWRQLLDSPQRPARPAWFQPLLR